MIVVDASAAVEALLFQRPEAAEIRRLLVRNEGLLAAPDHFDVEVLSGLQGLERREQVAPSRVARAVRALPRMAIDRYPAAPLLGRAYSLRHNLSAYDGIYVALAEVLRATLLTRDRRLAQAPGLRIPVHLVG